MPTVHTEAMTGQPSSTAGRLDALARRWPLPWSGSLGALIAFALALTPSLLPRPAMYIGAIAGISALLGYGVGVLLAWVLRKVGVRRPSALVRQRAWVVLAIAAPVVIVLALVLGGIWQEQVRELVGEEPAPESMPVAFVIAVVVFALLTALSKAIRAGSGWLTRQIGRIMPIAVARAVAIVLIVGVAWWVASGVLAKQFVASMDTVYSAQNDTTEDGVVQPTSPLRSGSPDSLMPWDTLGRQGRTFVSGGPTVEQIATFQRDERTGGNAGDTTALEPIRVYAGLQSADDAHARAELAVRELERTGAFDRAVLVVAGATGTGWLEPQGVDSIEYMWGGNTAIVTSQYSFLPSWISFLVDQDRASDAGRELFDAVHAKWSALPANDRPKLIAYGLSLGSFSIQAAFGSSGALTGLTDGALLVGTPNFAEPWRAITNSREPGTPEWLPVYRGGEHIQFMANEAAGPRDADNAWGSPRVLYLQHPNDPVVWWSWDLLAQRPDWLVQKAPNIASAMVWIPGITFLQVTIDQFFGVDVPVGQGHNYANNMAIGWAEVTQPPGWTPADTEVLQLVIDNGGTPVANSLT